VPPALMVGADFMGGAGYSTVSATTGISFEALFSPNYNAGYFAWNFLSISVGGTGSYARWSVMGKAGIVMGSADVRGYEGWFVSVTLPLKRLPEMLRDRIAQLDTSRLLALAERGLTGLSGLGPAAARWGPVYQAALDYLKVQGRLWAKDLRSLNQLINKLPGGSYLEIFFSPEGGNPWGFAFLYGVGNAGSWSITGSYYWLLGTW